MRKTIAATKKASFPFFSPFLHLLSSNVSSLASQKKRITSSHTWPVSALIGQRAVRASLPRWGAATQPTTPRKTRYVVLFWRAGRPIRANGFFHLLTTVVFSQKPAINILSIGEEIYNVYVYVFQGMFHVSNSKKKGTPGVVT